MRGKTKMTVARDLADFLVGTTTSDLPPQAMQHAAMVIASTIASAAYGTQIRSARIIRDLTREQGGRPDASLWFDNGAKLPVAEVARARGVPRAQVALAWLLAKPVITAPIVGATRLHHLDDAVAAVGVKLSPDEIAVLEEPYIPHAIVGFA